MLADKDRIFTNLYGFQSAGLKDAQGRGDWDKTAELMKAGPDAIIECAMVDGAGSEVSRCLMTVAYVDRQTNRAADWPESVAALFFEKAAG